MKTCSICGAVHEGDQCPTCNSDNSTSQVTQSQQELPSRKLPEKIERLRNYEKKSGIPSLILTAVFAVIFTVIALTSHINFYNYNVYVDTTTLSENSETTEYEYFHFSIPFFKLLSLISGTSDTGNSDEDAAMSAAKIAKAKADAEAEKEFATWLAANPSASEKAQKTKLAELRIKHYEQMDEMVYEEDEITLIANKKSDQNGLYTVFLAFGMIAILILIALVAIASVISLLVSTVKTLKKKPTRALFKMLFLTFLCSTVSTILTVAIPSFALSGSFLALSIVSGISLLLYANAQAILFGTDSYKSIIKLDIVTVLLLIAAFISLAPAINIFLTEKTGSHSSSLIYGGYWSISHVSGNFQQSASLYKLKDYTDISQLIMIIGALFAGITFIAVCSIVYRLDYKNKEMGSKHNLAKMRRVLMIGSLILAVLLLIFKFAVYDYSDTIASTTLSISISYGAALYMSIALIVIALVFDFVYHPEKKAIADNKVASELSK